MTGDSDKGCREYTGEELIEKFLKPIMHPRYELSKLPVDASVTRQRAERRKAALFASAAERDADE